MVLNQVSSTDYETIVSSLIIISHNHKGDICSTQYINLPRV